jgi:chromosome partitioning protein
MENNAAAISVPSSISLDEIKELKRRSHKVIERLRARAFAPHNTKTLDLVFTISQAAEMVGRTTTAIRDAESQGRLPEPAKDASGRRKGYSFEELNHMREVFGTLPWRAPEDEPAVVAIQSFKGGVSKTILTVNLAHELALLGYRVLIVDLDPQGTSTTLSGFNPDLEVETQHTLYPFLVNPDIPDLGYALRETNWPNVKLIPANLGLYSAEYDMAAAMPSDPVGTLTRLKEGINTIKHDFDVILIDPPPALGMLSLSCLTAANGMVIPAPPRTVDFASTAHFFTMLDETLESLAKAGIHPQYNFVKVIASQVENTASQEDIVNVMRSIFGDKMFDATFLRSAEINNAATDHLCSVVELMKPTKSTETYTRCRNNLKAISAELEMLLRKTWPSHLKQLKDQGLA